MSAIREEELIEVFKGYFEEETMDSVKEFANDPTTETYTIDLERFERYDADCFSDTLINNPDKCLENAKMALEEVLGTDEFVLRLENPPERNKTDIRKIRTDDINELMFIEGTIAKSTDVQPKIEIAKFKCHDCGATVERVIDDEEINSKPSIRDCPNADNQSHGNGNADMELVMHESRMEDYQRMRVQESPEDMEGDDPKNIDVTITGDDVAGIAMAGQKVTVTGVLRVTQREPDSAILDRHIEGVNVELEEATTEDINVTDEDIERIEEIANSDDVYEQLAVSIEPTIHGYETERKGAAFQIFSGVKKEFRNSGDIRGNIHVLYVGDPGTGKSRILKYVADLSPTGGVFTSGKGTSSAGITAAAVRDQEFGGNDKWTLKAGALVMADQGMACVDELDKMDDSDRSALHEGLEQQQISISKAGINATLNSRCSLLAAANPKHGRFDEHEMVSEQINLEPALMSRFDLIFIIQDEPEEDKDRAIADQILDNNVKGQENVQEKNRLMEEKGVNSTDELYQEDQDTITEIEAPVPKDLFQKYVAYAQENYHPKLSDEARDMIREKYVSIRQDGAERDVISLTARALDDLVRLTEAAARIKLSNVATEEHAQTAITLYEQHLKQVGVDPDTGEYDADVLESGTSTSQRDRMKAVKETISELAEENDYDGAKESEIIGTLVDEGFEKSNIEEEIGDLARNNEIYSPGREDDENTYKVV